MQVLCTAAKLEVTPFMLFGMYSEKVPKDQLYQHRIILLNNRPLNTFDLPFREQMYLETVMKNYIIQIQNGGEDPIRTRVESRYPFFTKSIIYPFIEDKIYNEPSTLNAFEIWFKQKVSKATKTEIASVLVIDKTYQLPNRSHQLKLFSVDTVARF